VDTGKPAPSLAARKRVSLKRQPLTVPRWYALVVICTSMALLAGAGLGYTSYVDHEREQAEQRARVELAAQEREADREWCAFLITLRDALAQSSAPGSPFVVSLSREVRALIESRGC
jgi:hypothetical protein